MRTLEQIREDNQKYDLLFRGMEEKPVKMSSEFQRNEKEVSNTFVKPISRRVQTRYLAKTSN
jgi:hypothetical protein